MAPPATQSTSLEEYGCTDSRTIVDGESLYVEYYSFLLRINHYPLKKLNIIAKINEIFVVIRIFNEE
jgi:hypothetical protein